MASEENNLSGLIICFYRLSQRTLRLVSPKSGIEYTGRSSSIPSTSRLKLRSSLGPFSAVLRYREPVLVELDVGDCLICEEPDFRCDICPSSTRMGMSWGADCWNTVTKLEAFIWNCLSGAGTPVQGTNACFPALLFTFLFFLEVSKELQSRFLRRLRDLISFVEKVHVVSLRWSWVRSIRLKDSIN